MAATAYCAGCGERQQLDGNWREVRADVYGELKISPPFSRRRPSYDGSSVYACGQGSALVLVERWLHTGTFEPAQAHIPQPQPEGEPAR